MRKVVVGAMVSMDGVMQAPGGPEEDRHPTLEAHVGLCDTTQESLDELIDALAGLAGEGR